MVMLWIQSVLVSGFYLFMCRVGVDRKTVRIFCINEFTCTFRLGP